MPKTATEKSFTEFNSEFPDVELSPPLVFQRTNLFIIIHLHSFSQRNRDNN